MASTACARRCRITARRRRIWLSRWRQCEGSGGSWRRCGDDPWFVGVVTFHRCCYLPLETSRERTTTWPAGRTSVTHFGSDKRSATLTARSGIPSVRVAAEVVEDAIHFLRFVRRSRCQRLRKRHPRDLSVGEMRGLYAERRAARSIAKCNIASSGTGGQTIAFRQRELRRHSLCCEAVNSLSKRIQLVVGGSFGFRRNTMTIHAGNK